MLKVVMLKGAVLKGAVLSLIVMLFSVSAMAKDEIFFFDIQTAMQSQDAKERIGDGYMQYFFGEQSHGKVVENFVSIDATRKTNGLNKSNQEACDWAFLSAMIALRERAIEYGGNAIVNIRSYYKNRSYISVEKYECHVGGVAVGVALKGDIVKIEEE